MVKYEYMGTRNKQLFKRFSLLFLVGILLASSLVTLINPETTYAKTVSAMTLEEEAASATYYNALSWCVLNTMGSSIATELGTSGATTPSKEGSWFQWNFSYSGQDKAVIYSHSGKSIARDQSCESVAVLALKLWGWTDYTQFLKDMEYRFDDDPDNPRWIRDKGAGQSLVERFWGEVQRKVYEKSFNITISGKQNWGAPMSGAAEWLLMSTVFSSTCSGKVLGLYPNGITDPSHSRLVQQNGSTGSGNDRVNYTHLNWFEERTNSIGEYGISYKALNGRATVYGWSGDGLSMTCQEIAEKVSSLALLIGMYAGQKACEAAGVLEVFPDQAEGNTLSGCADGFIHKTPFNYCLTTYPAGSNGAVNERRKACYFGQGNQAGEACRLIGFTSEKEFAACIYGSKNKSANCTTKYTMASPGSGATHVSQDEVDACKYGQTITISKTEIDPYALINVECGVNSAAAGCEAVPNTCAIAGIGWLLCPIINFLAEVGDSAYQTLSQDFLQTDVDLVSTEGGNNGAYIAWGMMRTVANVAFVIVFLIIIFSQLTGAGITNYGVKKMLPRLVIGVILVNLSFLICQLAVDVTNILGGSIGDVFTGVATEINSSYDRDDPIGSVTGDSNTLLGLFGGVLSLGAVGIAGYFLLSAGGTFLLAGVLALLVTLLILILRQVIIVLAIVVAPIVFVAWILPNTQNLFKQWIKIFSGMLFVFPIIALIYGGASLASAVLGKIAVDQDDMLWQIIASLLPAVSLIAVIPVLQGAIKAVPAIGQLATKMAGRANANFGKKASESYRGSVVARGTAIRKQGRENYRNKKFAERVAKGGASRFFASGVALDAAGKAGQESLVKSALEAQHKTIAEEVTAARAEIDDLNLTGEQKRQLAVGGTLEGTTADGRRYSLSGDASRKAAIQDLMATGSVAEIHSIVEASKKGGSLAQFAQSVSLAAASSGVGSKDPALAGAQLGEIAQGNFDYAAAVKDAASKGKYTAESFAAMDNTARARALEVAQSNPEVMKALRSAAAGVRASAEISGKVSGNKAATDAIDKLIGPAPAP